MLSAFDRRGVYTKAALRIGVARVCGVVGVLSLKVRDDRVSLSKSRDPRNRFSHSQCKRSHRRLALLPPTGTDAHAQTLLPAKAEAQVQSRRSLFPYLVVWRRRQFTVMCRQSKSPMA